MQNKIIFFFFSFLLAACGPTPTTLIQKSLRDNQGISKEEFAEIRDFIQDDKGLQAKYPDDAAIEAHIRQVGEEMCHAKRGAIQCDFPIATGAEKPVPSGTVIDFYFENSGSMDGYLSPGDKSLKTALFGMMTNANMAKQPMNLIYVNDKVSKYKENAGIDDFLSYLDIAQIRKGDYGDRGNSNINSVLKQVAESCAAHPDHIAVVFSDYIYSVEKQGTIAQSGAILYKVTNSLLPISDKGFAVLIIRINSRFDGKYYDANNKPTQTTEDRPAYIWVFGKHDKIIDFTKQQQIHKLPGYDKHLILQGSDPAGKTPYHTILTHTFCQGRFKKSDRNATAITAIEDVDCVRNEAFQFGMAVDLSGCLADEVYRLNPANYEVKTEKGDKFEVTAVAPIVQIHKNDEGQKGTATHILTIKAPDKMPKGTQKLEIRLKKSLPVWVAEHSTDSDATPAERANKTLGLRYLIEGAAKAFRYDAEPCLYHSFPITIKN